jgi:predicted SAM-dependent methyltransferase|tara:strand:+ start:6679 stop:7209 length:531 start_codon:yes stop_codon:yes gene_type:complete
MLKLHLGCGTKHLKDYINIDIRYLPGVDEVNNIRFLRNYKENSVDEIYACHVLEHFGRWEYKSVLERWFKILKPEGILRLAVPNFESICQYYTKTSDLKALMGLLYGGQDYDENYHYVTFDKNHLSQDLISMGFKDITLYDSSIEPFIDIDDFSKAFLPHKDTNGILMSLNIIASK